MVDETCSFICKKTQINQAWKGVKIGSNANPATHASQQDNPAKWVVFLRPRLLLLSNDSYASEILSAC